MGECFTHASPPSMLRRSGQVYFLFAAAECLILQVRGGVVGKLALICTAILPICSLSAADFFPLAQGNTWTYRNALTGASFTVTVGAPATINERVYYSLEGYMPKPVLVRLDEQKNLTQVDPDTGREQTLTVFSTSDNWTAPSRTCPQQGSTLERRGSHDGPAGPLHDVLQIQYRILMCADVGDLSEQYAENIGMVRRVSDSIAGPQTFDLTHATVGSIEIEAPLNARFTVSFRQAGRSGMPTAVLRLRTNSPLPVQLQFATGQEYDVVVMDDQGQTVWKWSDGQFFTQALYETTVTGEWTAAVEIPALMPGNYTINAWLTTMGPNPSFAATLPVSIAASN